MHKVAHLKNSQKFILGFLGISLFWAIPESWMFTGNTICIFKNLFGLECVGCGMTRALYCLSHGDILEALNFNRLVIIIAPLLFYILIIQNLRQRPIH